MNRLVLVTHNESDSDERIEQWLDTVCENSQILGLICCALYHMMSGLYRLLSFVFCFIPGFRIAWKFRRSNVTLASESLIVSLMAAVCIPFGISGYRMFRTVTVNGDFVSFMEALRDHTEGFGRLTSAILMYVVFWFWTRYISQRAH